MPVINHKATFAPAYQNDPTNYFVLLSHHLCLQPAPVPHHRWGGGCRLWGHERAGHLVAQRDVVQFVEMRQFVSGAGSWDKEQLARSVLAEIPTQLCSYMKRKSFKP